MELLDQKIKDGGKDKIMFLRYRNDEDLWRFRPEMKPLPTETHAALLARVCQKLADRGIPYAIQYFEPVQYLTWLAGRPDSLENQTAWAREKE